MAIGVWYLVRPWYQWPEEAKDRHITFKELVAILLACAVWGDRWTRS